MAKYVYNSLASGGSTVVEYSLNHIKVKGLSTITAADINREKWQNVYKICFEKLENFLH